VTNKPASTPLVAAEAAYPPGVSEGLWNYVQSAEIAEDYDEYFAFNSLFDFDEQVVLSEFDTPGVVVDLGAGTGRALLPLLRRGHRGVAVDLSEHMLRLLREKAELEGLPVDCRRANLVELDCLPDGLADYAMCLFSTLGMIQGRANRRRALEHACRILKPGGKFVVHAHNLWWQLREAAGAWWLLVHLSTVAGRSTCELGDRRFEYRGVPRMQLHLFRRGELVRELRSAGFRVRQVIPLERSRRHPLPAPWLCGSWRANGWVVICDKSPLE